MDDTIKTKGILKKSHSTPPTQVTSLSWLSRIQSKLSLNTQQDTSFRLKRQDLERVTFSIGQLTTEHLLYDDTQQEQQLPSTTLPLASATITDYMPFLPHCYEKSCRLREEKEWPLLMDLLQSHCNTPLTNIDLNGRTIYPATMGPFSDILLLDFGLRTLRLSNCGLNDESIGTLLNSLLKTDTVVELDISHNPLKNKSYKLLSIYIVESKSITSLDISKTSPDQRALHYLSRALLSTTSLQHLNMNQCSLKATQLEAIAPGICRSPSLTSLSLCHNRFSSNSIHILATLISKEHQPTEVDYDNQIYEHDKNDQYPNTTDSGLEKLDLTGNPLQDMAIGGLCQALGKNRTLKHLSLANCQIYSNGCELVADALYSNQCLETLDLSINPLMRGSDKGIHALKSALLRNDTLRQLVLTNTDLDATAAIMIAEVLPMNTALTRLDLSQNPSISLAGILALSVSVKMNRTITFLDISIPTNDVELSDLQNDIAAVCTTNMIQQVERSQHKEEQHPGIETTALDINMVSSLSTTSSLSVPSETTESPPSSLSSITGIHILAKDHDLTMVPLPSKKPSLDPTHQPLLSQPEIADTTPKQTYQLDETALLDPMQN